MTEEREPGLEPAPVEPPPPIEAPQPQQPVSEPALSEPQAQRAGGLKRFGTVGVVIAGVLGFAVWKFVLPLVLVGVAGQVFGAAFGGPYNRLPGDVRQGFEQRFEAAVGEEFKSQTEAEQEARVVALVTGGLPRLDDAHIDTNYRLTVKGMQAVDAASCANIATAFFAGTEPPDEAFTALVGTLSDAELQQWFEIRLLAIEAESRGAPPAVLVGDEAVNPLFDKLFVAMNETDRDTFVQLSNGATVDDAKLCAAMRGIYGASLTLAPSEVVLFARYDISP